VIYFLDASALAKRYLLEAGTDRVRQLFRRNADIAVSRLSEVEVTSALVRRANAGDIDPDDMEAHLRALADDLASCDVVEIRRPVVTKAKELVQAHALRAYDAMQLAAALRVKGSTALTFMCADGELCDAAAAERLRLVRL
jgi:hypothetical protein